MKFIKFFEAWYDDYSDDLKDMGFELGGSESGIDKKLSGKFRGIYKTDDLLNDLATMVSRMSDDYQILKLNNYFNSETGRASFDITVGQKIDGREFIEMTSTLGSHKFFPFKVIHIGKIFSIGGIYSIKILGKMESGETKILQISRDIDSRKKNLEFWMSGLSSKKLRISNENLLKLFHIMDSGSVELDYIDRYSEIKNIILGDGK